MHVIFVFRMVNLSYHAPAVYPTLVAILKPLSNYILIADCIHLLALSPKNFLRYFSLVLYH